MIKNIVKGKQIFSKKATPATEADRQVITDLLDTRVPTGKSVSAWLQI